MRTETFAAICRLTAARTAATPEELCDEAFAELVAKGELQRSHRKLFALTYHANFNNARRDPTVLEAVATIARRTGEPAPQTAAAPDRAVMLAAAHTPRPPRLDPAAAALYAAVDRDAAAGDGDFFATFARRTGNPDLRQFAMPPSRFDGEAGERDKHIRRLASKLAVGYIDAAHLAELDADVQAAEANSGRSTLPWEDTASAKPPRPYGPGNDEDFERDKRRAAAAGVPFERELWQHAAEQGRDHVHEQASAAREATLKAARATFEAHLEQCQRAEADRRQLAIADELARQAADRRRQVDR